MKRFLLLLWLATAQAQELVIDITGGRQAPIPIVVLSFRGKSPLDPAEIIKQDLRRTGLFEPLKTAITRRFDFQIWRQLGQEFLVQGSIIEQAGQLKVHFVLYDLYSERQLVGNRFTTTPERLRRLVHRISDQIYEAILRRPGPFSTRIAFVERTGDLYRLLIADYDGENAKPILISPEPVLEPVFSPSGSLIAYTSLEGKTPSVYVQEVATGERQRIATAAQSPAFSPDGRMLAFVKFTSSGADLYLYDLLSGEEKRLTTHIALDTEPRFAPDGKSIVFTSDRGGKPQLYRLDLATHKIERLTFEGEANTAARFLPQGRGLVLVQSSKGRDRIALFDLNIRRFKFLTEGPADDMAAVAPSGDFLLYTLEVGGKEQLGIVSINGRVREVVPSEFPRSMPTWSLLKE